jgi:hypothetical protein
MTRNSEELAQQAEREIAASSRTSPTPPGPNEGNDGRAKPDPGLVEAINQVFALFRLNYHNQYYAAFSEAEQLRQIKKLWLESLRDYPPAMILQGARQAIESSDYLPTLNRMRQCCEESLPALGLPAAHEAYLSACRAPQPAESAEWAHPAVYWAGRDCGWRFLATSTESEGWPVFERHYRQRCAAVLSDRGLPPVPDPPVKALSQKALEGEAAAEAVRRLRKDNAL